MYMCIARIPCTGFKGNARVILPGLTACIDCTLDLYPPQVSHVLYIHSTPMDVLLNNLGELSTVYHCIKTSASWALCGVCEDTAVAKGKTIWWWGETCAPWRHYQYWSLNPVVCIVVTLVPHNFVGEVRINFSGLVVVCLYWQVPQASIDLPWGNLSWLASRVSLPI